MGAGCKNQCPTCRCARKATIVGAGLVGSLWAVYLGKAGYEVDVFERRPDMRLVKQSAGKSINLATSYRGWKALDEVGLGDTIRNLALPMGGRTLHAPDGQLSYQPYGQEGQAIWSVSRGAINEALIEAAETYPTVRFHFNEECVGAEPHSGKLHFINSLTAEKTEHQAEQIFVADGAFSSVRYHGFQRMDQFNFSQEYIPDGYREILLPARPDGTYALDPSSLHIWPRGRFMLIALPNADGSFTCTLFMPFRGEEYNFESLNTKEKAEQFFQDVFPDFYALMPEVAEAWEQHPLSSLAIIRCYPWTKGKMVLMGDAAHATVPFFGQGMNCGFEDCSVLWELMQKHEENWPLIFDAFQRLRKPNGDAVQDLSLQNYLVMRDKVSDPTFQLVQRIERLLSERYPATYFPLYTMVSFSGIAYEEALRKGNEQEGRIRAFISLHQLTPEIEHHELSALVETLWEVSPESETVLA